MIGGQPVVDSSALIALSRIGQLDLLQRLYVRVVLPAAVATEVGPTLTAQPWLVAAVPSSLDPRVLGAGLGPGESEVISLALERGRLPVILDEERARRLAVSLGLPTIGTVGVVVEARRQGHIARACPVLDALVSNGFYASRSLYELSLRVVGEWP